MRGSDRRQPRQRDRAEGKDPGAQFQVCSAVPTAEGPALMWALVGVNLCSGSPRARSHGPPARAPVTAEARTAVVMGKREQQLYFKIKNSFSFLWAFYTEKGVFPLWMVCSFGFDGNATNIRERRETESEQKDDGTFQKGT